MKLKIISDGTPAGTRVVNIETGEELEFVTDVSWSMSQDGMATATIKLAMTPVEIVLDGNEKEERRGPPEYFISLPKRRQEWEEKGWREK